MTRVRCSIRARLAGALLAVLVPLIVVDAVHCWHRWTADRPVARDLTELGIASLLMIAVALYIGTRLSRPIEELLAAARVFYDGFDESLAYVASASPFYDGSDTLGYVASAGKSASRLAGGSHVGMKWVGAIVRKVEAIVRESDTGDELAELTRTFQEMAIRIRRRERHLRALVETGQRLGAELDRAKVCRAVVEQACSAFHATTANLMLYHPGTGRLEAAAHCGPGEELFAWRKPGEGAIGGAFQSRELVFVPDVEHHPGVAGGAALAQLGLSSLLAIPLLAKGKATGVLSLCVPAYTAATPPPSEDREALGLLASQAAAAIENARLHQEVEDERARLDAVIESMPAGVCFTEAEHGQIILANAAAARLLEMSSKLQAPGSRLDGRSSSEPSGQDPAWSLEPGAWSGSEATWDGVTLIRTVLHEAPRRRLEARVRQGAGKSVPLLVNSTPTRDRRGQVTGAVAVFQDITPFKESEARLEAALAKERRLAELLQTSFLPEALPLLPGLEWGSIYRAAQQEARIGGDFYDAVDLGSGRVALAIGDVSGKGVSAAVYTALAKYSWRAFIAEDPRPGPVMERLNRTLHRYVDPELFVTMFYGLLDTRTRRLTYVSAGHLPALVYRRRRETCAELETHGLLLGVVPSVAYAESATELEQDDVLLLYTDGIVEIRRDGRICDETLPPHWLRKHVHRPAPELVAAIYQEAYDFSQQTLEDDVALLAARIRG